MHQTQLKKLGLLNKLIIYSSDKTGDECEFFDEQSVLKGSLDKKEGYKLMSRLINDDF